MKLKKLPYSLTVCKLRNLDDIDLSACFYFVGRTDAEISLVCESQNVPRNTIEREDGWRGFCIEGILDFSLIGILAAISSLLAEAGIGIFAVSTFNTDYILVKKEQFDAALKTLSENGYDIVG